MFSERHLYLDSSAMIHCTTLVGLKVEGFHPDILYKKMKNACVCEFVCL